LGLNMTSSTGVTPTVSNLPFTGQVYTIVNAGVLNTYYPGTASVTAGATSITLGTAVGATVPISVGDTVLIIQMQDAAIDSTNASTYGTTSAIGAGVYEYAIAGSNVPLSGGTLTIPCGIRNAYNNAAATGTAGQRTFQVIRVPVYASTTLSSSFTALAWNGSAGGALVFDVTGTLTLGGATVSVNGMGFRGGATRSLGGAAGLNNTDYRTLATVNANASKGEGIAGTPRYMLVNNALVDTGIEGYPNGSSARGAPADGGGGGTDGDPPANDQNPGGGGGANYGAGGIGGIAWCSSFSATVSPAYNCPDGSHPNNNFNSGGIGGYSLSSWLSAAHLTLGGGGGGGTSNNGTGTPANGYASSGAAGGGMIMIRTGSVTGSATFTANGSNANNTVLNDGGGGAGAGGAVMIFAGSGSLSGITVNANGGTGGTNTGTGVPHGPGGGGGGGYVITSSAVTCSVSGGASGTTQGTGAAPASYGAAAGSAGNCTSGLTAAQISGTSLGATSCIDHYAISGSTTGVTCDASAVTITAHDTSHNAVSPSAGTTLSISTSTGTGVWQAGLESGGGTWTPSGANNGAATYVWPGGESSFIADLRQNTPATLNINLIDSNGKTESALEDLAITFADTAFRVTADATTSTSIGTQISGKNSNTGFGAQTLYLQAIRTDTNTGSCVGLIKNRTVTIEMAGARINPTSGSSQLSVLNSSSSLVALGTGSGGAGTYANVSLAFDVDSKAPLVVNYPDAGGVQLYARYQLPTPPSGTYVAGTSNTFVVRPFGLRISGPPSGRTGPGSTVYAKAGQNWPDLVTVTAVAWKSGDDTNVDGVPDSDAQIASNTATPNFGQESTPATVALSNTLAEPSGGNTGTLTVGAWSAFSSGAASASASWSEVGLLNLFATSSNYLGSGQNISNSATGYAGVGRFYPDHFSIAISPASTLLNRSELLSCSAPSFTYMGENFGVAFTLQAKNTSDVVTQNYTTTSGFAKLAPSTSSQLGFGARSGTTNLTSRLAPSSSAGTFTAGAAAVTATLNLNRNATPDGNFTATSVGIAPTDSDGVALQTASLDMDVDNNSTNDHRQVGSTTEFRFGRLRLQNANGSQLIALPVPVSAEYWNGTAFITNGDDNCTQIGAANIVLGNYKLNLSSGETTLQQPVLPSGTITLSNGAGLIKLSAPGSTNNGSVDVSINLTGSTAGASCTVGMPTSTGAGMIWLQGAWCGTAYDDDPTARATFGIYTNSNQFIYQRENY